MPPQILVARVERLEERVTKLEELPARVDALSTQVSQLREEMHSGFSNLRDELRTEIRVGDDRVMEHARELCEALKEQIQAGDEQIMTQTRMLFEDLRADWAKLQEGRPPQQPHGNKPDKK